MTRRVMLSGGLEQTVTRPIIITLCKDIMTMLQMDQNTYVQYGDQVLINKSDTGRDTLSKSLPNKLLSVNVKENPVDGLEVSRVPLKAQTPSFYADKETNTSATTIYKDMELHLEVKFRTKSKAEATSMVNRIGLMTADSSYFNRHNLDISYEIPSTVGTFIGEVYKLKKSVYTDLTEEDFSNNSFDMTRIDRINSLSSLMAKSSYVLREAQVDVLGYINGDISNKEAQEEDQYHVVEFTYTISYLKPIAMHISFPILIFNKTLPNSFTGLDNKPLITAKHFESFKDLEELLTKYSTFGINYNGYYLTHPPQDDFTQPYELSGYQTVMSLLTVVDPVNTSNIMFNINNIGGLSFKDSVKELMIFDKDIVGEMFNSLFFFALYENDRINFDNKLFLDEEGNVKHTIPLDITKTYRVFIYVINDATMLSCKSKTRTLKYLNDEIEYNRELRKSLDFSAEIKKDSSRSHQDVEGVEQVKTKELFLDSYFSFFRVSDETLYNAFSMIPTLSPADILFKIKMPDFGWSKLTLYHHTDVSKLIKEV